MIKILNELWIGVLLVDVHISDLKLQQLKNCCHQYDFILGHIKIMCTI